MLSVVKFDKSFDRESFDCGVAVLNDFLKIRASQYIKRYEAVVYCAFDDQTQKIAGFTPCPIPPFAKLTTLFFSKNSTQPLRLVAC